MQPTVEVVTPMLTLEPFLSVARKTIDILQKHYRHSIELTFESFDENQKSIQIEPQEILKEIANFESIVGGNLWRDEVLINVYIAINKPGTTILLCHEKDIHLRFNTIDPLVAEVLRYWDTSNLIFHVDNEGNTMTRKDLFDHL